MGEGATTKENAVSEDEALRATILASARAIADREGAETLSLGQVAAEAEVPRTTVYRLFARKEDLLMSIVADDLTTIAHKMRGQEWPSGGTTPESAVPMPKPREDSVEAIVAAVGQTPVVHQPDAWLERRLRVFEKALAAMEAKQQELERHARQTTGQVEQNIKDFADQITAIDERVVEATVQHKSTAKELRQVLSENLQRIETVENVARAALAEPTPAPADHETAEAFEPAVAADPVVEEPAAEIPTPSVEPTAFVDRRRQENQGAVSFIVERRKSMLEAQVAADAANAAQETRKTTRLKARRQRLVVASSLIAAIFGVAAFLAFSKGVMDGRATALRAISPSQAVAFAVPHIVHASRIAPLDRLTAQAESGDPRAELTVALRYLNGDGTIKNPEAGFHWLTLSAVHGQPVAQYFLGTLYQEGRGTATDMAKAIQWYEAAALQGNRKAMHDLAIAYADGSGGAKNAEEAARWFSRAASFGYVDSQFDLAVLYERGDGVPQSLLDAYKWYAIASAQGDSESKDRIEALRTQMSPVDVAVGENAARNFHPLAMNVRANVTPQE